MPARKFKTRIIEMGPSGAWACIQVPFDVEQAFGSKARVPVRGTLNRFRYRSSIFPDGRGSHLMMVNKRMRIGAKVDTGDAVAVTMELDAAARTVTVPGDFKTELARNPKAQDEFSRMAYSHRKEYVEWITAARKPETRAARLTKALKMIAEKARVK